MQRRRRAASATAVVASAALVAVFSWAGGTRVGGPGSTSAKVAEEAQESLARFDEPAAALSFALAKRSANVQWRRGAEPLAQPIDGQQYLRAKDVADRLPRITTTGPAPAPAGAPANDFGGPWQQLGPGNIGGRTRQLLIDPANANIMYAAAVAGGVWKTTNGGTTWAPLDDLLPNLAVNSLAMDPNNSAILYAGTGEGFFNFDAVRGAGIFKSTDSGASWTQLATTANSNFFYVNDIVVSKGSSARLYAATRAGVFRSLDSGATWTSVGLAVVSGGCLDLAIRTDVLATDTVFAACGNFTQSTIYRNTDAGGAGAWTSVYTNAGMGRASLAIAPSNQDTIYALGASIQAGQFNNGLFAVLRSTTGGASGSWAVRVDNTSATVLNTTLLSNPPLALGCFGSPAFFNQGWYDNVIAVDPADPNRVWTGGVDLFRSDDGGANFGLASYWYRDPPDTTYAHADQHVITFAPGYNGTTNRTMFVGNDGGIQRTTDARAATATGATAPCPATATSATVWASLNNGYQVTQFFDGVPYPNGTSYFGGTQDNGTLLGSNAAGANAWSEIFGGDGGYVAVDPTNTNTVFLETTRLSIRKSTAGSGGPFNPATSGITESSGNFLFINPFHMAPANPQALFTGGFFLWRTTNQAVSWTQASAVTPGTGNVSAWATSPTSASVALAGMSDGFILRNSSALTSTSATTWPNVQPRGGYVSSLIFHPTNPLVAYATYSSFGGGAHVWRTADGGATWSARDGSAGSAIPDIPVHTIAINPANPARLYAGTDLGVFVSLDEGLTWARENTGFANVVVEKLAINTIAGASTLYAFTHGRSAWRVPLATTTPPTPAKRPADFDGDGDTDRSVYRNGAWFAEGQATAFIGQAGDIPVPGDYDNDGDSDRAVYRNGTWFTDGAATVFLGTASDIPVPGDYDGDGDTDRAVFRPSVGGWYVEGQAPVFFGLSSDIPVPGDYDNDGDSDMAVFRPSVGGWYVNGQTPQFLGLNGDIPVPGDYNGDGDTERAIWRPNVGGWYVEGLSTQFIGLNGDVPVPGDYDGDGDTERGIWRPGVGGWYIEALPAVFLGLNGDIPLPLPQAIYRKFF